ncbi:MAG: calcium-binding protein, partial [Hyphomicrobium sp.]
NRTADAATTSPVGGLLEAAGMGDQKHFTEMLRSRMFKDVVLGDGGADGSADVAVFRGNRADYAVTEVPFTDASGAIVTAYKITDLRAADVVDAAGILVHDGTDIVVGVEKLQFADMALLSGQFLNTAPTGAALLSGFATANQLVGTVLAEQTAPPIAPMVVDVSTIADAQGTGALGIQWQSLAAGATVWTNIAGATGATYDPMAADIGSQLRAVVSYTDGGGVNERVISAASDVVGNTILGTLNNVANVLAGTAGQDIMFGRGGNDTLNGAAGNDWLDGGTGNDTMNGGLGNDTYVVNATGDVTNEGGNEGIDTVRSAVARTLGNNLENLTLTGTGTIIGTGNALDNVIIGGSGNNTLTGAAGNDTVSGGLGNDTFVATVIVGGTDGDDTYDGGDGVDTLNLSATSASPTNVNLSGAARTVAGQAIAAGTATSSQIGTDTLISIENVNGSSGNNVIVASDAANTINGAGGNDVIAATVDNVRDTFNGGTGTDTADYSAYTTGLTVSLNGTATVTGSGDTDANSDRISAFENFTGGSGQDTITGSSVDNVLDGGDGIDTYSMAATTAAANVNLATGTATSAQIGTDTLISIENINGGTAGDIIVASTAANIINGNGGQDVVVATVDDVRDTFNGGTGIDTADYSGYAVDLAVTLNLNTAVFVSGSGSEFANLDRIAGFENFTGGSGADLITGDNAANALSGGDGNDLLSGGLGADVLTGGAGNDTFVFNAAADSGLTTTTRDTIVGFEGGGAADGDLIDLSGFGLTFSFVGTGIFTAGAANQIRYALDGTGNNTIIQISVDTDTGVEASILLQGYTGLLNVNDFTL